MNRRDLFKHITGVAATAGVTGASVTIAAAELKPALAVLEYAGHLSSDTCARLTRSLEGAFIGTPFDGVKALVLDRGLTLTLLGADGRVLNERIDGNVAAQEDE